MLQVLREKGEEAIMDANNITADMFRLAFSPQRENLNTIFASEKVEISDELVKAV